MVCEKACDLQPRLERPFGRCPEEWHESINAHWTGCPSLPSRLGRGYVCPVCPITHCSNFTKLYLMTTATAAFSSHQQHRISRSRWSLLTGSIRSSQSNRSMVKPVLQVFLRIVLLLRYDLFVLKLAECFGKVCPVLLYSIVAPL